MGEGEEFPSPPAVVGKVLGIVRRTIATSSMTGWTKYHAGFDLPKVNFLHTSQPDYYNLAEPVSVACGLVLPPKSGLY